MQIQQIALQLEKYVLNCQNYPTALTLFERFSQHFHPKAHTGVPE
jgi:hypothetical protein